MLLGLTRTAAPAWTIDVADDPTDYHRLRREVFVAEQGLFAGSDHDDLDDDPRTVVLEARADTGELLGGVRLACLTATDIGWWSGGRLAVTRTARGTQGIGPALVRAACAHAEARGVLRFDATVQAANEGLFHYLGWETVRPATVVGIPHVLMRWPLQRYAAQAAGTKAPLGPLLAGLHLGGPGFVGDDGAPVPGTDVIAACDAIVPSLVERDPEWAGWCGVLVNVNDLWAMGATSIGLLDSIGARDASFAARVVAGLRDASAAYRTPVLGGHTQFGVPAALSVTALGRTTTPVRAGAGEVGDAVSLTADLGGSWRRGYTGRQWDSTTSRTADELAALGSVVAATQPHAAKDVSMAGLLGTLGMLAEASGCGAVLDVAAIPKPREAGIADWLACFPGFAMLTADDPGRPVRTAGPATTAVCGELTAGSGVQLRWPDGELTHAVPGAVTGLGLAGEAA
ncbi:MSMEG_0567/sll0787 family protein [Jatrophihabitans sp.]|uniref:MSMEG_0567/sll0787 family protein n=1 Tax=Jatrophihabitans sp. TaxID=1932789 RepID=UPI0030C783AC